MRRIVLVGMLALLYAQPSNGFGKDKTLIEGFLDAGKIVHAREIVRGKVVQMKLAPVGSPNMATARDKYNTAYAAYAEWIEVLRLSIENGDAAGDLRDPKSSVGQRYAAVSKAASDAGIEFIKYVDQTTAAQTKGGAIAALSSLVDVGIKVWKEAKSRSDDRRRAAAKTLAETTQWERWDDIKSPNEQKPNIAQPTDKK